MPTRREFITGCSALALTASVAPAAFSTGTPGWRESLDHIRFEDFLRQLNTAFSASLANGSSVELRLVEVRPFDPPTGRVAPAGGRPEENFALLFRGPGDRPLAQETRCFTHPRLGRFAMFIVPIGCTDRSHCYYEAIFYRPVRGTSARISGGRGSFD